MRARILSIGAYFALIIGVGFGGVVGAKAILSTVPAPDFLLRENQRKLATSQTPPPLAVEVVHKPYPSELRPETTWKTSIVRAYAAPKWPAPSVIGERPRTKKKVARHKRERRHEAMDAYAWTGSSWR